MIATTTSGADSVEALARIVARLERLPFTRYQAMIFAAIASAWLFDSIDLGAMTFLLGPIKAEFRLSTYATGVLASASFLGMFLGASLSGMLADRIGRKTVFQVSMLIWGVGSVLCGFAHSVGGLSLLRVLVGFGMGMEFPVAQAIAAEITPQQSRGRYLALLEGFWPIGLICAGIITALALPSGGWRMVFFIEGLPSLFLFVVRQAVPESPRWLVEVGRSADAELVMANIERHVMDATGKPLPEPSVVILATQANRLSFPLAELWSIRYRGRTVVVWSLWFFALLGYYGITTWLSTLLQARGFSVTRSTWFIVAISAAGIPGFAASAILLDCVGRKAVCVTTLLGGAVAAFLYGHAETITGVVAWGALMQFFLFGMWSVLYAYTPEIYPTRARATGTGWASAIGRVGSLLGPIIVGLILPRYGQGGVFLLGAGAFVLAAIIVAAAGRETRGLLEEVSA